MSYRLYGYKSLLYCIREFSPLQTEWVRFSLLIEAIAYVEGVLRVTRQYAESRMVWVDKERKMPLAELPYMKKVLHSVEATVTKTRNVQRPVFGRFTAVQK